MSTKLSFTKKMLSQNSFEDVLKETSKKALIIKECHKNPELYLLAQEKPLNIKIDDTFPEVLRTEFNGSIYEKDTNKLVCMPSHTFIDVNDEDELLGLMKNISLPYELEYCEDGTSIRLYNHDGCWITATNRCLNAKYSKWSSKKSFDKMFWECFDDSLLLNLDKEYTYMFVLRHTENRLVVKHSQDQLVYICKINNNTGLEDWNDQFNNPKIERPLKINFGMDIEDITSKDLRHLFNNTKRGIALKFTTKSGSMFYKLDFPSYTRAKELRGNDPCIYHRYIELLSNEEAVKEFEYLFSEYKPEFYRIQSEILQICRDIFRLYISSHVKRSVLVDDKNIHFRTLKQLHAQYKTTGVRISIRDVVKKVIGLKKHVLVKFLDM